MTSRLAAVADQLLLIERALRLAGLWGERPASAALQSQQPFCVDTLRFEQWLQWVFLPRMKLIVEAGAPLPSASGIRPMAEEVYAGQALEVGALLEALDRFDRLIGSTDGALS